MWWTIVAAVIASVTVLVSSTAVYTWQKRVDRKVDLSNRKVKAYSDFLSAASSAFSLLAMANFQKDKEREALDKVDRVLHRVRLRLNKVALLSDNLKIHESFSALQFDLWAYRGHLRSEILGKKVYHKFSSINGSRAALGRVKDSYDSAMLNAKLDIGGLSEDEATKILNHSRMPLEPD